VEPFLAQRRDALVARTYRPWRNRRVEIPTEDGKVRVLGMPALRDRVVQGARKHILEPSFAADVHDGSYGYRPKRTAQQAVDRVAEAIVRNKTRVMDGDLAAYVANVRHDWRLVKVARRVHDRDVWPVWKRMLRAAGTRGVPQGGVVSPLLSNLSLPEVAALLERAKAVTATGTHTYVADARDADDLGILVNPGRRQDWLVEAINRRLREELAALEVRLNEAKSRIVDRSRGERVGFLGVDCRRLRSLRGRWRPPSTPPQQKRMAGRRELKAGFRRARSQPVEALSAAITPQRRGWGHDVRSGHASRGLAMVRRWVERKVRRQVLRARNRRGFGWQRWSTVWRYHTLGLCADDRGRYLSRA
jgi:RNA-directed DNA polymerase